MAGNPYRTLKPDRIERISEEEVEVPLVEGNMRELEGTVKAKKPQVQTAPTAQSVVVEHAGNQRYQPASRNWHPISEYYEDDYSTNEDDTSFADAEEGRTTSPVRVDVTAGHPSLVNYRQAGHGKIVDNHYSDAGGTYSHTTYKPYRKVERVLGVKVTPTASGLLEIEHTIDPGSQKDEGTQAEVPIVQALEKHTPPSEAQRLSPRSKRLPLTSHPVQSDTGNDSTISNPAPRSKRVSYEIPPIDLTKPKNFSRQKITTTPYPRIKQLTPGISGSTSTQNGHGLVLCLYGHNQSFPRYTRVMIPVLESQSDKSGTKEKVQVLYGLEFDDEQLFLLMQKAYRNLRGPIRRLLSMQRLKSLNLISWSPFSTGIYKDRNKLSLHSSTTSSLPESQIWEQFQTPKLGRGRYEWVEWMHKTSQELRENSLDEPDEIGVEFVEGWSVWRIVIMSAVVWLLSLAAGTLWIILGVDREGRRGWHSAGARVNTGVLFSGVILMMGWSLIGAWALLSWLTS